MRCCRRRYGGKDMYAHLVYNRQFSRRVRSHGVSFRYWYARESTAQIARLNGHTDSRVIL